MTSQPAQQSTFIPDKTTTYLTKPYWDERFASEESYEWCKSFEDFGHLLRPHFTPYDSILEIGAGNSSLSSQLAAELSNSYVCSLDISQVGITGSQCHHKLDGVLLETENNHSICLHALPWLGQLTLACKKLVRDCLLGLDYDISQQRSSTTINVYDQTAMV